MNKETVHHPSNKVITGRLINKLLIPSFLSLFSVVVLVLMSIIFTKNILLTVIISFFICTIYCIIAYLAISKVVKPIAALKTRISAMSENCDYHSPIPYFSTNDEIESLCLSVQHLQNIQVCHMEDLIRILGAISNNHLDVKIHCGYMGDFNPQKVAIENILHKLNSYFAQINSSTTEISSATQYVANGIQVVSQGTVDQGEAVVKLSDAINKLYEETQKNAQEAVDATNLSTSAGKIMMSGSSRLDDMMAAMEHISTASQKISKVIKTVDDIAFQTNILALNASVEAARAGSYGKGFAVVAEEVRNLANKSAEASQGTADLIESAILAVEDGISIAKETSQVFTDVLTQAKVANTLTENIATAITGQEASIKQMTVDIDRINEVIQRNSAIVQDGAAASEELSSQSHLLNGMVKQIVLEPQYAIKI